MLHENKIIIEDKYTLIVFDTNALLEFYSYPDGALRHIINKFNEYNGLFWIPKQVYIEFLRHNKENRAHQLQLVRKLKGQINTDISHLKDKVTKFLNDNGRYKAEKFEKFKTKFEKDLDNVKKHAKKQLEEINDIYIREINCIKEENDIVSEFVEKIKSDMSFTQLELIDIYEEGEKRYKYNIAPGFTDKDKNNGIGVEKYNDLVIWKEILRKIEGTNCKLIFIQNEKKADWWSGKSKNKPQDVLVEEFKSVTNELAEFEMMHFKTFLNTFAGKLGISGSSIQEINKLINLKQSITNKIQIEKKDLIQLSVNHTFEEVLTKSIEEKLLGEYILFGFLDQIKNIEIDGLNIYNTYLADDSNEDNISYIMNADIEIMTSGDATVYISRDYSESISFSAKNELNIDLYINVDTEKALNSNLEKLEDVLKVLKVVDICINENENLDLDGQTFDSYCVEESYYFEDSNISKDIYNICPDCGKYFGFERDGGNGFCIECASKY